MERVLFPPDDRTARGQDPGDVALVQTVPQMDHNGPPDVSGARPIHDKVDEREELHPEQPRSRMYPSAVLRQPDRRAPRAWPGGHGKEVRAGLGNSPPSGASSAYKGQEGGAQAKGPGVPRDARRVQGPTGPVDPNASLAEAMLCGAFWWIWLLRPP